MTLGVDQLRSMPAALKQRTLVTHLRRMGECAFPDGDGVLLLSVKGGRISLTIDEAIARVNERSVPKAEPAPAGPRPFIDFELCVIHMQDEHPDLWVAPRAPRRV